MNPKHQLAKLAGATRALSEIKNAKDAKVLMDTAAAAKHYAQKAKLGQEAIDYAHSIKIQAETILGRFLMEAPKNKGAIAGGKKESPRGTYTAPRDTTLTLADLGLSKKESSEAQAIAKIAQESPALHSALVSGEITVAKARSEVSKTNRRAQLKTAEWPKGKFRVIYADPPWKYNDARTGTEESGGVAAQYETMSTDSICALPVESMATRGHCQVRHCLATAEPGPAKHWQGSVRHGNGDARPSCAM